MSGLQICTSPLTAFCVMTPLLSKGATLVTSMLYLSGAMHCCCRVRVGICQRPLTTQLNSACCAATMCLAVCRQEPTGTVGRSKSRFCLQKYCPARHQSCCANHTAPEQSAAAVTIKPAVLLCATAKGYCLLLHSSRGARIPVLVSIAMS